MRHHTHYPFFSQRLGAATVATCLCGAQRRQVGPNLFAWRLPHRCRQAS